MRRHNRVHEHSEAVASLVLLSSGAQRDAHLAVSTEPVRVYAYIVLHLAHLQLQKRTRSNPAQPHHLAAIATTVKAREGRALGGMAPLTLAVGRHVVSRAGLGEGL